MPSTCSGSSLSSQLVIAAHLEVGPLRQPPLDFIFLGFLAAGFILLVSSFAVLSAHSSGKVHLHFSGGLPFRIDYQVSISNDRALRRCRRRHYGHVGFAFAAFDPFGTGFVPRKNSERVGAGGRIEEIILGAGMDPNEFGYQLPSVHQFGTEGMTAAWGDKDLEGRKTGGARQTEKREIHLATGGVPVPEDVFDVRVRFDFLLLLFFLRPRIFHRQIADLLHPRVDFPQFSLRRIIRLNDAR